MCYCGTHDEQWDSDLHEICPLCEPQITEMKNEKIEIAMCLQELENTGNSKQYPRSWNLLNQRMIWLKNEINRRRDVAFNGLP